MSETRAAAEKEAEAKREEVKKELQRQLQVFKEEQEDKHNKVGDQPCDVACDDLVIQTGEGRDRGEFPRAAGGSEARGTTEGIYQYFREFGRPTFCLESVAQYLV